MESSWGPAVTKVQVLEKNPFLPKGLHSPSLPLCRSIWASFSPGLIHQPHLRFCLPRNHWSLCLPISDTMCQVSPGEPELPLPCKIWGQPANSDGTYWLAREEPEESKGFLRHALERRAERKARWCRKRSPASRWGPAIQGRALSISGLSEAIPLFLPSVRPHLCGFAVLSGE